MTPPTLPELDALVAEKVMGWKRNPNLTHPYGKPFSPTTNDADAFAVLAKLCVNFAVIIVEVAGSWTVAQVTGRRIKAEAPTLREAICRFALRIHG